MGSLISRPLALVSLFLLAVHGLDAQNASWTATTSATHPYARTAAGIAYDPATKSAVVFGGSDGGYVYNDTWVWVGGWHRVYPGVSPSARQGVAMAFDGATGEVVLFGGSPTSPVGDGTAFGDTWTWNGLTWTQQHPPVSPPARVWSSMVYVPATRTVLLFGGTNSSGANNPFDDSWAWNGVNKTWTQLQPAHQPSARTINQLVYDVTTRSVLLFGGVTSNQTPLNDTWTWNGADWTQVFPATSPAPRNSPALVYCASIGAVVLFGGAVGTCCADGLNDTWTWNGNNWTETFPSGTLPMGRNGANMVYVPNYNVVLMFGGHDNGAAFSDSWLLSVLP